MTLYAFPLACLTTIGKALCEQQVEFLIALQHHVENNTRQNHKFEP